MMTLKELKLVSILASQIMPDSVKLLYIEKLYKDEIAKGGEKKIKEF